MKKSDIERLWELEIKKIERIEKKEIPKEDVYVTALDFNDEIIIIRSQIKELSDTGIIVIANPDRADKDGEIFILLDLNSIKMMIFTQKSITEENILEFLDIIEEADEGEFSVD